ncbi:MAG: endo-1,4-beta-xylanase [Fibrobacter sp.]|nr:endo-1,4-beta-xylanase [Fibrobacter sp.]
MVVLIKGELMKRLCVLSLAVLFSCLASSAQEEINITGTVSQKGGGALADVSVALKNYPQVSAKTDSDGKFALVATGTRNPVKQSKKFNVRLQGRDIVFNSSSKIGNVSVYSANGRQLVSMDLGSKPLASQRFTLPEFPQGLNFLSITSDNKTTTHPLVQVGNKLYLKDMKSVAAGNQIVAQMHEAAFDTIIAQKENFKDSKIQVNEYILSDVKIEMEPVIESCDEKTLKDAGKCGSHHEILIGTAVSPNSYGNAAQEFNYVTAENAMKWDQLQGSRGNFNYGGADQIVNWAQQNGIKVKGHCLVWHSQLAGWVNNARGRDEVLGIMYNHIENVMKHFGNKVHSWDVVNEAIATTTDVGNGNARMRESTQIGPDYIELAFRKAREVADNNGMKDMKLYYNDYSIDADNDKSKFARKMIKELVDKGVPIDGVGFQMHIGPPNNIPTVESVRDNMQYYADLGLEVLISEWDINLCANKVSKEQQLELYRGITEVCVNQPKCVAITFWGINDENSWLNSFSRQEDGGSQCNGANSGSLLFSNNQKKEVYYKVLDALNGK